MNAGCVSRNFCSPSQLPKRTPATASYRWKHAGRGEATGQFSENRACSALVTVLLLLRLQTRVPG